MFAFLTESDCSRSSCSQCTTESSSSYDVNVNNQNDLQIASTSKDTTFNNDYLTTNFNTVTPKTYRQTVPRVPPIPNVDLPKVNFTKSIVNAPKPLLPNLLQKPNMNIHVPLIPPPLPVAPRLVPKHLITDNIFPMENHNIPKPNSTAFLTDPFLQNSDLQCDLTNNVNPFVTKAPPLPVTTPLIVNPVLPSPLYRPNLSSTSSSSSTAQLNINNPLQLNLNMPLSNQPIHPIPPNKKPPAKVKFSDTVTAFIVPEIRRPVRPLPPPHVTDPQKELADSLPLCHPNEDYLKDFTPVQRNDNTETTNQPKIKVVHFGVV